MDKIVINGGKALFGKVKISGAKNASLPLITASLLTDKPLFLHNVPDLADIRTLHKILASLGVKVTQKAEHSWEYQADGITSFTAEYDLVKTMRASFLVLGPLLARFGECKAALPGGCAIGLRPVNFHLDALREMGADIEIQEGYVYATTYGKRLKGAEITFPKVSVGATENTLMAATLAEGTTILNNASIEPEITDLAECLQSMGADISGIGTSRLVINGVESLHEATHSIIPDRIESITYAIAAAITKGKIEITDARLDHITAVADALTAMGAEIKPLPNGFSCSGEGKEIKGIDIVTTPYPGFPTDAQAQIMALMLTAHGQSTINETVFENRFMHVPEMQRMNADIQLTDAFSVTIAGSSELKGAPVMASDLRASAGLVLAALAAHGETVIDRVYHLDRGYEDIEAKLSACGADIRRIKAPVKGDSENGNSDNITA
ncbi:MAG: UDP-N-acetylglucosamine 1-carboxyvinyltransferase [Alphaproteobacteria bacterium]|nr:UDP-N-acetylglucosamine 1-carboxyvinyltransferase [Alphaproteobacteria bacterium]